MVQRNCEVSILGDAQNTLQQHLESAVLVSPAFRAGEVGLGDLQRHLPASAILSSVKGLCAAPSNWNLLVGAALGENLQL